MSDSEFISRADVERVKREMGAVVTELNGMDPSTDNNMYVAIYYVAYQMLDSLLDAERGPVGFLPTRYGV